MAASTSPTKTEFRVRLADWGADHEAIRAIREQVFVREQRVPIELEWDGLDAEATHVLALAQGEAIGTARMLRDGHIGRVSVLASWRGRGIGGALLERLVAIARERSMAQVVLGAQTHAIPFYQRHGFEIVSEEFMDAGIPHREMRRILS